MDFLEARSELDGRRRPNGRTVERIDAGGSRPSAMLDDRDSTPSPASGSTCCEDEIGELPREEKPVGSGTVRPRDRATSPAAADSALAVILAWSLLAASTGPGLVAEASHAGPPGASISSTSTPWQLRGWRNATGPSAPLRGAVSISSTPSMPRRVSSCARFVDLEADVMEALALVRQEAGDAGRVVRRLDELDLRLPHPEERDPDPVLRDVHDRLERQAQEVPVERQRILERLHDRRPRGGRDRVA